MTDGHGKSDRPIVPEKPSNKAAGAPAAAEAKSLFRILVLLCSETSG
jgi:hypothetical protein